MSVGSVGSTGPLFMASTPTITGPRPTASTPPETPKITSNPSAFEGQIGSGPPPLGATTSKEEVCKAVDGCESPDGSVPELDGETTGMEGQELDGDFADATGEMPEVESAEGGSDGPQEVSEGGEAEGPEEASESDGPDGPEETGESDGPDGPEEAGESDGPDGPEETGDAGGPDGPEETAESGGPEAGGEASEGSKSEGTETTPGAEAQAGAAGTASTAPQPASQGEQPGGQAGENQSFNPTQVGGKALLTATRTATAVNEYRKAPDARQGLVKPMPAPQGATPSSGNVTGAKLNTVTAAGTVRHLSNLADGNLTGSDVVAAGELANTAAGALHTKQGSQATAVLLQRAGGMAAGAGVAGFAVNLANRDFSATGQNISDLMRDPGNAELQSQLGADLHGLASGVQDITNAARGAVPALEAAKGTLGTATTTAGRIAQKAAGPAAHAAASASRAAGRLVPGVNVALAVVDGAAAAADINKAMKNPTRDNVVQAGLSGVRALGSAVAATNIPGASQAGAAVAMAADAAKLAYEHRDAIASAVSNKASAAYAWAKSWF